MIRIPLTAKEDVRGSLMPNNLTIKGAANKDMTVIIMPSATDVFSDSR
jgi:hypothetical protein